MSEILKGAVGLGVRGGPKVQNDKDDILLVRRILRANKYNVAETGGKDVGLLKALSAAAKKAGIDPPIGMIEPNSVLMKSLKPKYMAAKKKEQADAKSGKDKGKAGADGGTKKLKMKQVTIKGKTVQLLPDDYDKEVASIFKKLDKYINSLISSNRQNQITILDYYRAAEGQNGMLEAFVHVTSTNIPFNKVRYPDLALAKAAEKAIGALVKAKSSKDIRLLNVALPRAEAAVNALTKDVLRFLKGFAGGAGVAVVVCSVTSAVGFTVVGAMAAPMLVTVGMTAGQAAMASAAACKVVETASGDLGKVASGQDVTLWQATKNASIDGIVAALTAGAASKIKPGFLDKITDKAAGKIASKFANVSKDTLGTAMKRFAATPTEEGLKASVGEVADLMGKRVKSGKAVTRGDVEASLSKIALASLTGGFLAKFGDVPGKTQKELEAKLSGKIVVDSLRKIMKGENKTVDKALEKAVSDAMKYKLAEELTKSGLTSAFEKAKGTETGKAITKLAVDSVMGDQKTEWIVNKRITEYLKKKKLI